MSSPRPRCRVAPARCRPGAVYVHALSKILVHRQAARQSRPLAVRGLAALSTDLRKQVRHSSEAKKRSSAATMISWLVIRLEALNPLRRS